MCPRASKKPKVYTQGEKNRIIDSMIHPFFKKTKSFVFLDGILHGLVEKNPELSARKFIKYNLPELLKPPRSPRKSRIGTRRHYNCTLPLKERFIVCKRQKASSKCLKQGAWGGKCSRLIISYK